MESKLFILGLFFILCSNQLAAQNPIKKEYFPGGCNKADILVDGKLNEPVWIGANWQDDFSQYEPYEGKDPSQKTEFAILLDENYIFHLHHPLIQAHGRLHLYLYCPDASIKSK